MIGIKLRIRMMEHMQYYDDKTPYKYTLKGKTVEEKNVCLSAGWEAEIRKMCETNKKKNGTPEPLVYNPVKKICVQHLNIVKIMVWIILIMKMVNIVIQLEEKFGEFLVGSTIFKGIKRLRSKCRMYFRWRM